MKNHNAKLKNSGNKIKLKNFGFFIAIFIFSLFIFNLKEAHASFTISRPSTLNAGLVGYWTFDGGKVVNGVALDSTGNANNGNLIGIATSTFYSAGKIGQGFNFDGVNDYVNPGNPSILSFTAIDSQFTFTAWVKPDSHSAALNTILSKWIGVGNQRQYAFVTRSTGELNLILSSDGVNNSLSLISVPTLQTTKWQHAVVTADIGTDVFKMYIDGVEVSTTGSAAVSSLFASTGNVNIGSRKNGTEGIWDGIIDDLRVYNRVLSASEVKALYNQGVSKFNKTPTNTLTSGLVGHWTFDGGKVVNGVVLDSTANANNGNLISIATSTFYSIGRIGQGFNFDGVNDRVDLGNPASLQITGSMTISAWAKLSSIPTGGKTIIGRQGISGNRGWIFMACGDCSSARWVLYIASNGTTLVSRLSNSGFTTEWTHVVGVYNASAQTMDVYINGTLDNGTLSGTVPASQFNSSYGPDIGSSPSELGGDYYFPGLIDDLRVYNRALSASEVKALYNQGVSKFNKTPTNTLTSGLVGHWTFDGKNVVNGVALDSTGNANNGNLVGIATSTFYAAGKIGQGFNFDGTNDYASSTAALNPGTSDFTFSLWIYPESFSLSGGSDRVVFSQKDGTGTGRGWIYIDDADSHLESFFAGAAQDSGYTLSLNTWVHAVLVHNNAANTLTWYVNGVKTATNSGVAVVSATGAYIFGTSKDTAAGFYDGGMDDVRIYDRVLSAGEVKMLYNMGR